MLDIQLIRQDLEKVKKAMTQKGLDFRVVDDLLKTDKVRRDLIGKVENLKKSQNELMRSVKGKPEPAVIKKATKLKLEIVSLEPELKEIEEKYHELMLKIPSVPASDVPVGNKGKVVRTGGKKPKFDFEPKDHIELGETLGLLDLQRGSKVAGFRGYFLKNEAVLMHLGLIDFALKKLISKGFTPIVPPIIDKPQCFFNTGHFPWGEKEAYKLEAEKGEGRYLAGTAEVPLVSYHANEVFSEKDLPIKYVGFSPCFRREIGNYGKDAKGLYRIHEFLKVEQVVICKNDMAESEKWLETLASYSEEILQELGLCYQVVLMPTGDMGEPQIKKYDIETWMPGRNEYGETMSDSMMGDFQARRANIKYQAKGETKFVHMLNNTAIATPRILIALWETHQQRDGSIKVPEVLQEYVGKGVISKQ